MSRGFLEEYLKTVEKNYWGKNKDKISHFIDIFSKFKRSQIVDNLETTKFPSGEISTFTIDPISFFVN